jgi:anti-sigma factor ChrR (cupin superfamily)
MITEEQQELASLYAAGALPAAEREAFEAALRDNAELRELTRRVRRAVEAFAMAVPHMQPPPSLKDKVMLRIEEIRARETRPSHAVSPVAGLRFLESAGASQWKSLPVPGTYIKLLSFERERGYAVLLGKLDPGARYPAHVNAGPEDFFILTGDLVVGDRKLVAGDFHHAEQGSQHDVNYSVEGCTLLAVLTTDDPLVAFAMA